MQTALLNLVPDHMLGIPYCQALHTFRVCCLTVVAWRNLPCHQASRDSSGLYLAVILAARPTSPGAILVELRLLVFGTLDRFSMNPNNPKAIQNINHTYLVILAWLNHNSKHSSVSKEHTFIFIILGFCIYHIISIEFPSLSWNGFPSVGTIGFSSSII